MSEERQERMGPDAAWEQFSSRFQADFACRFGNEERPAWEAFVRAGNHKRVFQTLRHFENLYVLARDRKPETAKRPGLAEFKDFYFDLVKVARLEREGGCEWCRGRGHAYAVYNRGKIVRHKPRGAYAIQSPVVVLVPCLCPDGARALDKDAPEEERDCPAWWSECLFHTSRAAEDFAFECAKLYWDAKKGQAGPRACTS